MRSALRASQRLADGSAGQSAWRGCVWGWCYSSRTLAAALSETVHLHRIKSNSFVQQSDGTQDERAKRENCKGRTYELQGNSARNSLQQAVETNTRKA